jgi:DNA-binding SARP family transcriptional activator
VPIVWDGGFCTATLWQQLGKRALAGPSRLRYVGLTLVPLSTARMDFRILGPLEALEDGERVALGGTKRRAVLALLLLHANETLTTDRLVDELWGEEQPAAAAKTVQVHISRLRKALGDAGATDLLVTRENGYELVVDPEQLDARRFERLVAEGRSALSAGEPEAALEALEAALSLWRGAPLADLAYEPFVQREAAHLEDMRAGALEQLVEAKLAVGRHQEVIGELEHLIEEHPYREHLRAQLMLALYRADRQADALQVYQDARRMLVEELGIEPGERLRELERAVLAQDPALAAPARPPPAPRHGEAEPAPPPDRPTGAAPPPEPTTGAARRLVSIVFADIVGSTGLAERLDPETMHGLLDRYSEVCGEVIERHGGTVEGFIGDAVVGVFGMSELHEDDALRAVRAAVELREAGAGLSVELERDRGVALAMKLGVESGEVFVGAGARRSPFAAGDAFNVAARLEGTAPGGEILLGENVYGLVRGAVRAEPMEPLALKGRSAPVQAWRLVGLDMEDGAGLPAPRSPFVGRDAELEALRAAFARAREEQTCHAVTVVGPAGIGKSRLARELLSELEDRATVAVGRCPSYGEAVAYRPLAEIVRQLGGGDPRAWLSEVLQGDEQAARLVLSAIGLPGSPAQAEEIFWAVRRLFERVAAKRPLVLFVEDVHWAEPALRDLLEYLLTFSSGSPMLIVCLARPEFVETDPGWVAPLPNRSLLMLDALSDHEARRLVDTTGPDELGPDTAARIVELAEGNPLFLEQLAAMGAESGETALPSTVQAVLTARIDQLEPDERAVLELASVEGRSFHAGAVAELLGEHGEAGIAGHLVALVQKRLVRPDRAGLPGEDAFRFAHVLIREAAYHGVPKQRRAELHERLARWLEARPAVQDEHVGHHLVEAYLHRVQLGPVGERERALASAGAARLASAANAALLRGDAPEGARFLERAESLLERDDPARLELVPRFGAALLEAGRLGDADRVLSEALESARGDDRLQARARVERQLVRLQSGPDEPPDAVVGTADSALRVFAAHRDELGLCRALCLRARQAWVEGSAARADDDWRRAAEHARRANDEAALFEILDWRASAALFGPTPVPAAIERCRQIHRQVEGSPVAVARTFQPMAALKAMAGDFDEADRLVRASDEILGELGDLQTAAAQQQEGMVEMLAGRFEAAEERLRRGYEQLQEMGERALLASTAAMLAQALYAQTRHEEAREICRVSEESAGDDDLSAQIGWRSVCAKLRAAEGRLEEAEQLAEHAVRLGERTDFLALRADVLVDLSVVLRQCGRSQEADTALGSAVELYRRKGGRAQLAALGAV